MFRLIYFLAVLFSCSRPCQSSSSAEIRNVQPGGNITLPCNGPANTHTAWYRLSNNEMILVFSAIKGRIDEVIVEEYHLEPSHFQTLSVNSSVSLVIVDVRESDAGLYYCGGRLEGHYTQFGKAILLDFPGTEKAEAEIGLCWKLLITATCILALALVLCVSMLLYHLGFQSSFCENCLKENSSLKAVELHYASLRHAVKTPQTVTVPADHSVTYDVVAKKTAANPRA
ncbi:uncharacterized protein [Salminus brasiliensis]|uniref:uncharacterized protein n=1 Tax=Salminus brasiliensis TaxID=930266 RepID=UPI003B83317A